MKEVLDNLVEKVNKRIADDEKYKKKLNDVVKTVLVQFDQDKFYNFKLDKGQISPVSKGEVEADIRIQVPFETFNKIMNKETDALTAYFEKKLQIKASLMDKLLLQDLLK
ncbi:sterol carrier protein [uncultured archaeon]|nr:sterol carrier protein [uncultured archaeon]